MRRPMHAPPPAARHMAWHVPHAGPGARPGARVHTQCLTRNQHFHHLPRTGTGTAAPTPTPPHPPCPSHLDLGPEARHVLLANHARDQLGLFHAVVVLKADLEVAGWGGGWVGGWHALRGLAVELCGWEGSCWQLWRYAVGRGRVGSYAGTQIMRRRHGTTLVPWYVRLRVGRPAGGRPGPGGRERGKGLRRGRGLSWGHESNGGTCPLRAASRASRGRAMEGRGGAPLAFPHCQRVLRGCAGSAAGWHAHGVWFGCGAVRAVMWPASPPA